MELTGEDGEWVELNNLLPNLHNDVIELAMDDKFLMALNSDRRVFQMHNATSDISQFKWCDLMVTINQITIKNNNAIPGPID